MRSECGSTLRRAIVLLMLAGVATGARADDAVAPKLEGRPAPTGAAADGTPALPLPSVVTICIDRSVHECWTTAGQSTCHEPARPHGEVFSTVSAMGDSGGPLRGCWESLRQ
jgi:hypothetical protein